MKVYIVLSCDTATRESEIKEIFSTRQKAEDCIKNTVPGDFEEFHIREWGVK